MACGLRPIQMPVRSRLGAGAEAAGGVCAHTTPANASAANACNKFRDMGLLILEQLKLVAVRPDQLSNPKRMRTSLARIPADLDVIARLQRVFGPAGSAQLIWSGQLALPLFGFAFVICGLKIHLRMRIQILEIRDGSFYRDHLRRIERRRSVVREDWQGNDE